MWLLDLFNATNPLVPSISPCLHWSARYRENHFGIFRSIGRLAPERQSISLNHRFSAAIKDTVDIPSDLERDRTDWPTYNEFYVWNGWMDGVVWWTVVKGLELDKRIFCWYWEMNWQQTLERRIRGMTIQEKRIKESAASNYGGVN